MGVVYLYLAFDTYFVANDQSEAVINLILVFFGLVFGYVNQFWHQPSFPDIILNDAGIAVEESDRRRLLEWEILRTSMLITIRFRFFWITGTAKN